MIQILLIAAAFVPSLAVARIPGDDAEVLERVAPRSDPKAREVRRLEEEIRAAPRDAAVAEKVARRFLALAMEEGDPRFAGRAQSALAPWWEDAEPPVSIRVLRAAIHQHNHDFSTALADLDRAVAEAPQNAQAWLTRAAVQQVRGDYAGARVSCAPLMRLARPLVGAACLAAVASLSGSAQGGEALLQRMLAQDDGAEPAATAWALTLLAEMAVRRGDPETAGDRYRRALAVGAPDAYLLASYADFLLESNRAAEVVPLLRERTRSDPLLLRLALAEKALGAPETARHVQMLRERFEAARLRGETVHRREEAMFRLRLLGEPAAALSLAQANFQAQREPLDVRVLLEAALAARDAASAKPALDFLADSHLEERQIEVLRRGLSR
jgi:Tfp pilus assembly protein PilF